MTAVRLRVEPPPVLAACVFSAALVAYFVWWLVVSVCRGVHVWWLGTCTILDWLPDRGERSRADGLRVLGACVYIFACWLAGVLGIVHILLAMLR